MYIQQNETIKITVSSLKTKGFIRRILNKQEIEIGETYEVPWPLLKTSSHRRDKINVQCDECKKLIPKRLCDLDISINYHICNSCAKIGNKNPMYGKPIHENTKAGLLKWMKANNNPFTWESSIQKIKEKDPWSKVAELNRGKKRTEDQKINISSGIKLAYAEGRFIPATRWGTSKMNFYKGIGYQSTYELEFLKYCESLNIFDKIERGPRVQYIGEDNLYHTYFVDYMLKDTNKIFEIKSTYIYNKNKKINDMKKEAASKLYDYYLIMDNNFDKLNVIDYD